ncbi:MAG: hypothetical protein KDB61_08020 [Planctomycetes bacterium]|nr:hypothetical protein [Planctomycetota bacterium]
MNLDYVLLKIDVERDLHGAEVALRLRGTDQGGIPWITITDAQGTQLTNADRPTDQGPSNIGCPVSEQERAWFMQMIRSTRQHMTEGQVGVIEKELAAYAKTIQN